MPEILHKIIESRKKSLENQVREFEKSLRSHATNKRLPINQHIRKNGEHVSIISEIKPSSPSLGKLRSEIKVADIAKEMEIAGVVGLSVLTEPLYFNGSFENLKFAIDSTTLPCLMKDFVFHESQFRIAKEIGATNILLINQLGNIEKMYDLAIQYELEPLIEVHYKEELKDIESLTEIGHKPKLIGVNNRNLNTMEIDLNTSKQLISLIKNMLRNHAFVISESGIHSHEDIKELIAHEADAFLIGSSIMQSPDIREKIYQLRGLS